MIPKIRHIVQAFLWDELAFTRWSRGGLLAIGGGGVAFGDQIAAIIDAPGLVKAIKLTSVVCLFLGGAITAGQRNPQPGDAQS